MPVQRRRDSCAALRLMRKLVKKQGFVSAESEEGKGSRFIVKVPVSLAPRDSQRGSEPPVAMRLADNLRIAAGTKLDCAN